MKTSSSSVLPGLSAYSSIDGQRIEGLMISTYVDLLLVIGYVRHAMNVRDKIIMCCDEKLSNQFQTQSLNLERKT